MDIDFITDFSSGQFQVSITDNPQSVSGNRALLNRFEITFMTKQKQFIFGNLPVVDTFGGDAFKFISQPQVLSDTQSIAASISAAIDQTVESIKRDQSTSIPLTERLSTASLIALDIIDGIITAEIEVVPEQAETYDSLRFSLPIVRR